MSRKLKILSLDGGGVRGVSALLILEAVMEKLRDVNNLEQTPRPCDYFDLIGGTSTGGIIAIMLGRLGMSVDQCLRAYKKMAEKAFTLKWGLHLPASPSGAFSATALEEAIKVVIREQCQVERCKSNGCQHGGTVFRDKECCRTAILAITKANVDALPTLFRTYDTSDSLKDCAIWQVARATSAATTFFKSIKCGRDEVEFIDAGFGYNNPCEILLREAQSIFAGAEFECVLSIGTGIGGVVSVGATRKSILDALKAMATSSQKVAQRLDEQYSDGDVYYRFNVPRGLEDVTLSDWKEMSNISAHTRNYLAESRTPLAKCSAALQRHSTVARTTENTMPSGES